MRMYMCPRCQTMSIPFKDKYRAGIWANINCKNCQAKLCASPILLAAYSILYMWDVAWFSGLFYYTRNPLDFVYMIMVWILLDYLNVTYMPLVTMRRDSRP